MARRSRRTLRIWFWSVAMVVGLVALTLFGLWLNQRRSTDLQDASALVTSELLEAPPDTAPEMSFRDVAAEVGVVMVHGPRERARTLAEDTGSGLSWGDYDGDGDFDLYLVNIPGDSPDLRDLDVGNRLFRNDGARFVDVTVASGTADTEGFGMGSSFVDFDDDGDVDLYVTNFGVNRLFRNRGDGSFEEVAARLGVADPLWSIAAGWGDFDRDGRLDLYVTNYVEFEAGAVRSFEVANAEWESIPYTLNPNAFDPQANSLYRQTEDGSFEEIALLAGASNPEGRSLGVTVVDLDADGWIDLYVANDVSPNALLRNRSGEFGGETLFEDLSTRTGTADPRGSMGLSVADLAPDGETPDGLPELFVTHWVAQENALYEALWASPGRFEYRDRTRDRRLGEISTDRVGWGSAFVDLDLDGRPDLAVANGSTLEDGAEPPGLIAQRPFLFWNSGERFYDMSHLAGEATAAGYVARGLAAADYDLDGDVDLALSVNRGRPLLLANESPTTHRGLSVRLSGSSSATIGARLEVETAERHQIRWWRADASFASTHADELLFGLGSVEGPVSVRVSAPNGCSRRFEGVRGGGRVVLSVSSAG